MNQNGIGLLNFLKIMNPASDQFLVVHDEINLPQGKVKLSSGKSAGGHNGVKSVIHEIGYSPIRMRIGIDSPNSPSVSMSDYVLENFSSSEIANNNSLLPKLVHGIHLCVTVDYPLHQTTSIVILFPPILIMTTRKYSATIVIDPSGSEGSSSEMIPKISEIIAQSDGEVSKVTELESARFCISYQKNLNSWNLLAV